MIIPQFSLRWMLAAMTLLALVFLVVSRAVHGSGWALGVSAAVLMLVIVAIVHGALFFLIWLVSLMSTRTRRPAAAVSGQVPATPFKTSETPPTQGT